MDFYKSDTTSFEKLNLTIADLVEGTEATRYRFKAYLDESEVSYQIIEQSLAYTPLSFVNDKVHTRTTQKVKLKFNVYSEDLTEAQENYRQLHKLIESTKPKFSFIREQYLPDIKNNKGLISVKFKGLPKVSSEYGDDLVIHLSQFSYDINKELGYIERPMSGSGYTGEDNRLIPVAYVLNIAGQILLPFKETIRLDKKEEVVNVTAQAMAIAKTKDGKPFTEAPPAYANKLFDIYKNLTGNDFSTIPTAELQAQKVQLLHELISDNRTDLNGNFIPDKTVNNFRFLTAAQISALSLEDAQIYAEQYGEIEVLKQQDDELQSSKNSLISKIKA
jgi:hypothetical protein